MSKGGKIEIFSLTDIELLTDNIDRINEDIKRKQLELFDPKMDDVREIVKIVNNFIKNKKRKVYGGEALNKIISNKSPKDSFYGKYELPDIDIYSPRPIDDLIELCNKILESGFTPVTGQEALHKGTYSIFVKYHNFVDITYVPTNVFHRIPFEEINGINYVHPHFMMVDMLRIFTDPLLSYFRLEKTVKRLRLIQKHYPIKQQPFKLKLISPPREVKQFNEDINKLLLRDDALLVGFEAYNQLAKYAQTSISYLKPIETPYPEIVLTDFKVTGREFIEQLKKNHPDDAEHISAVEYYPFFQFIGHSAIVYYKKIPIAHLYHYDHRCIPWKEIQYVSNDKTIGKIRIGSFSYQLLFSWASYYRARTEKDNEVTDRYRILFSHLVELRNEYFTKNKKNIFHDTPFAEFLINCIGDTIPPATEKRIRIDKNKAKGKQYVFRYDPSTKQMAPGDIKHGFANTAGTAVRNEKNLKLNGDIKDDYDEEETDVEN